MPKELTHWILADLAAEAMPQESSSLKAIRANREIYLAGAVLPDTLLHVFQGPHAAAALASAERFHNTRGNSFQPIINAEKMRRDNVFDPPLLSCLLGIIAHIQADIVFHPFVYALSGTADIGRHYRVETDMDVHFTHDMRLSPPVRLLSELCSEKTSGLLTETLRIIFDPDGELPDTVLAQSLKLHCRFQSMYDNVLWKIAALLLGSIPGSRYSRQRHLFYPLFTGKQPLFTEKVYSWIHPATGAKSEAAVADLAAVAVQRTVELFGRIDRLGSLAAALSDPPGENLLTGIYGAVYNLKKSN